MASDQPLSNLRDIPKEMGSCCSRPEPEPVYEEESPIEWTFMRGHEQEYGDQLRRDLEQPREDEY